MMKSSAIVKTMMLCFMANVLLVVSCKKDNVDDPIPEDPIVGTWKLTGATLEDGTSKLGSLYISQPCAADDQFVFATNEVADEMGTLSVDVGDLDCYDPAKDNQMVDGGTWSYKNNKTQLTITLPSGTGFPIPVFNLQNVQFTSDDVLTGNFTVLGVEGFPEGATVDLKLTKQD